MCTWCAYISWQFFGYLVTQYFKYILHCTVVSWNYYPNTFGVWHSRGTIKNQPSSVVVQIRIYQCITTTSLPLYTFLSHLVSAAFSPLLLPDNTIHPSQTSNFSSYSVQCCSLGGVAGWTVIVTEDCVVVKRKLATSSSVMGSNRWVVDNVLEAIDSEKWWWFVGEAVTE